ncbi:MAG: PQQ-binding-like beta-propeller repeat protein [Verrucomicrobiales bacterium]
MTRILLLPSILLLLRAHSFGDDWPQFRGPLRDGVSRETGLLKSWPAGGPKELWRVSTLGAGYSAPAIVGGKVFIMGQRDDAQWLLCLSGEDGKDQWRVTMADFGGIVPGWGYSESPLVDGDHVAVTPGGEKCGVVALEAKTGKLIWQSNYPIEETQFTSLLAHTKDGVKQYICVDREKLTGLAATDGKVAMRSISVICSRVTPAFRPALTDSAARGGGRRCGFCSPSVRRGGR